MPINWWMDNGNLTHSHDTILFSCEERWNCGVYKEMDGTGKNQLQWGNANSERQCCKFSLIYGC